MGPFLAPDAGLHGHNHIPVSEEGLLLHQTQAFTGTIYIYTYCYGGVV